MVKRAVGRPRKRSTAYLPAGRAQYQIDAIHRHFMEMPVIDARENLRVFVNDTDVRKARKKDPAHCVYANACRRLYGSHAILFFRSIAYVDLPDEEGNRILNRFILRQSVRQQIIKFDTTGESAKGGFLLSAPTYTESLDGKQKKMRTYYKNRAAGKPISKKHRRAYLKGRAVIAALGTEIRNGAGRVSFR